MEKVAKSTNVIAIMARALVDLRDRVIQKARIQFGNRIAAIERGVDDNIYSQYIRKYFEKFVELEKDIDESLQDLAEDLPIVEKMIAVKGVGKITAIKVAAMIDIRKADTISALWRYAGYGVVDGKAEKPKSGEKLHYNKRLKTACYLIGSSFLKSNSPYRSVYDEAKEYYKVNRPGWTKAHCHNAAMRKMIKVWLAHLWLEWRKQEGLPISDPYVVAAPNNGHNRVITPCEMGWDD